MEVCSGRAGRVPIATVIQVCLAFIESDGQLRVSSSRSEWGVTKYDDVRERTFGMVGRTLVPDSPSAELGRRIPQSRHQTQGDSAHCEFEGAQPEGVTEKHLGPSGARTSRGGEPVGHGAAPCAISHRPMAASRSSAHTVSGFQNDLVRSTSTRWPSGNSSWTLSQPGTK